MLENSGTHPNLGSLRCPRCQGEFRCGAGGSSPCWCTTFPAVMPVPDAGTVPTTGASCYCPSCLAELTAQRLAPGGLNAAED